MSEGEHVAQRTETGDAVDPLLKAIGRQIKFLRERAGLTQAGTAPPGPSSSTPPHAETQRLRGPRPTADVPATHSSDYATEAQPATAATASGGSHARLLTGAALATLGDMTTREELHALIDSVPDDDIDAVVQTLRPFIEQSPRSVRPHFIGMGRSGHSDTSARADEILRETGFGE